MTEIMPVPRNSHITVLRPPNIAGVVFLHAGGCWLVLCRRMDDLKRTGQRSDSGAYGRRFVSDQAGGRTGAGVCVSLTGGRRLVYRLYVERSFPER